MFIYYIVLNYCNYIYVVTFAISYSKFDKQYSDHYEMFIYDICLIRFKQGSLGFL